MPSHLKTVGPAVRRLLQHIRALNPARISYRIIDPQLSGDAGIAYAARKKVSPLNVRRVLGDAHDEERIWSSLVLAYDRYPEILIQGIDANHLPHLAAQIVAHLQAVEKPPKAVFAVAAPGPFQLLPQWLRQYGQVLEIDFDGSAQIPPAADLLLWMQPNNVTPAHIRRLKNFMAQGRSVILAGSVYAIGYDFSAPDTTRFRVYPLPTGWTQVLEPFGLRPVPDLLMDRNSGPVLLATADGSPQAVEAPFHLRCLPAFRNMKSFKTPARGGLNFVAASALAIDPRQATAAGFEAEIVATTTEHAWVQPLPSQAFTLDAMENRFAVPRQNLMVLLKPNAPWHGQLLALASSSPFQDGILNQSGYGHGVFLRDLVRTFADPQRLIGGRLPQSGPPLLPSVAPETRYLWRGIAVFLVPALFLALGLRRSKTEGLRLPRLKPRTWATATVGLALALVISTYLGRYSGTWGLDWTADKRNTLAAFTRSILAAHRDALKVEAVLTPKGSMPPALKGIEAQVHALFTDNEVNLTVVRPHTQTSKNLGGLQPFKVERVLQDTLSRQQVWSGLRLTLGEWTAVVPRLDAHTIDHLEFLVVSAVQRLVQGRAPHIAVVSDLPRLSPAEALEDYQKKGLSAPSGVDVYGRAKDLLRDYGYQVSHVHPRQPEIAADTDVILWFQPRRDSSPIIQLLADYLHQGGQAVIALQHFNIQQRQYRGAGFQTVYWPQPQFQDLDRYLRLLGVEQQREVLFDQTRHRLALDTQVNRTAIREYDPQEVALPFLIKAISAHYAGDSPVTRNLGDLLFIWGNRFSLNPPALSAAGLQANTLITTSNQTWSYAWKGGWLPPEVFEPQKLLDGKFPLALNLTGTFPAIEFIEDDGGRSLPVLQTQGTKPGSLLLIGSSEMFKNHRLFTPSFHHDQFLLNAVATAAYEKPVAALQSPYRPPPGFAYLALQAKIRWRLWTVATAPVLLFLYGALRLYRRQQPLVFRVISG